jgi:hypothetical protein
VARVVVKWNTRGKIEERIYSVSEEWIREVPDGQCLCARKPKVQRVDLFFVDDNE